MIQNWPSSHTNCVFRNLREVGAQLKVTIRHPLTLEKLKPILNLYEYPKVTTNEPQLSHIATPPPFSQIYWLLRLECQTIMKYVVQYLSNLHLFWCMFS